jgi:hypothetical protein
VSFEYLAKLRKIKKKKNFCGMGGGNDESRYSNEKPNQGVRERKKVGIHWSRKRDVSETGSVSVLR